MARDTSGVEAPPDQDEPAWRGAAVSRSLNAARSRAEERVQRFLDAAFELIDEKGSTEFTIQEVIERSKQSLRGFYEYFDGKDELVLALFEETVREADDDIRARRRRRDRIRSTDSAPSRSGCTSGATRRRRRASAARTTGAPISEFSMHLAVNHSERVRAALAPHVAPAARARRRRGRGRRDPRRRHPARRRARPADRDVQLVRQPPRREPEAAAHRRGDLGVLPPRPRRLTVANVRSTSSGGTQVANRGRRRVERARTLHRNRPRAARRARRAARAPARATSKTPRRKPAATTLAIECDVTDEASCRAAIARGGGRARRDRRARVRARHRPAGAPRRHRRRHRGGACSTRTSPAPRSSRAPRSTSSPQSGGTAAYLSSVSASLTPPWPGLGAYAVSKAALDKLVEAWRAEHPHVGFTRVVVGDCGGGEGDAQIAVRQRLGHGPRGRAATHLVGAQLPERFAHRRRPPRRRRSTRCSAAARRSRSRRSPSRPAAPAPA